GDQVISLMMWKPTEDRGLPRTYDQTSVFYYMCLGQASNLFPQRSPNENYVYFQAFLYALNSCMATLSPLLPRRLSTTTEYLFEKSNIQPPTHPPYTSNKEKLSLLKLHLQVLPFKIKKFVKESKAKKISIKKSPFKKHKELIDTDEEEDDEGPINYDLVFDNGYNGFLELYEYENRMIDGNTVLDEEKASKKDCKEIIGGGRYRRGGIIRDDKSLRKAILWKCRRNTEKKKEVSKSMSGLKNDEKCGVLKKKCRQHQQSKKLSRGIKMVHFCCMPMDCYKGIQEKGDETQRIINWNDKIAVYEY
ncbi:11141_t:CDS:2, partial [Acaulospora morrowiae]